MGYIDERMEDVIREFENDNRDIDIDKFNRRVREMKRNMDDDSLKIAVMIIRATIISRETRKKIELIEGLED